jgi:hypothetical protein
MPTVPRYDSRVTTEVSQARQNIRASADAFGAAEARALGDVSQGVAAIAEYAERRQAQDDETAAREAYVAASDALRDRMRGEKGFLTTQGRNAEEEYEQFIRDVDSIPQNLTANLSPRAREQFNTLWASRSESALNSGATHVFNERAAYQEQVRSAELQERATAAIESNGNAGMVYAEVNEGARLVREQASAAGADPEVADIAANEWRSNQLLVAITAALDSGNTAAAEAIYSQNDGEMLVGADRSQARGLIDGATQRAREQSIAQDIFARHGTDVRAARAEIREQYEGEDEDNILRRVEGLISEETEAVSISTIELFSQVEEHLARGGSVDDLPPQLYDALESDMRDYYRRVETGEPNVSNFEYYDNLLNLTPRQLRDLDPRELRRELADAEYNEIMGRRNREFSPSDFSSTRSFNAMIRSTAEAAGIKNDDDVNEFYAIVQRRVSDEEAALGRPLSPTEREGVVATYAAESRFTRSGLFNDRSGRAGRTESTVIPNVEPGHTPALEAAFSGVSVPEDVAVEAYQGAVNYLEKTGASINLYTLERTIRREYERELEAREEKVRANSSQQSE